MKTKMLLLGALSALVFGCQIEDPGGEVKDTSIGSELGLEKGECYFRGKIQLSEGRILGSYGTSHVNVIVRAWGSNPGDEVGVIVYGGENAEHCSMFTGKIGGDLFYAKSGDVTFGENKEGNKFDAFFVWDSVDQSLTFGIEGMDEGKTKGTKLSGYCTSGSETVTTEPYIFEKKAVDCEHFDKNDDGEWDSKGTIKIGVPAEEES